MADNIYLSFGLLAILGVIFYLTLSDKQREVLFTRFRQRKRTSNATTPPRSVTPEKRKPSSIAEEVPNYKEVFPPSRRSSLASAAGIISPALKEKLAISTSGGHESRKGSLASSTVIPFTSPIDDCLSPNTYTPTEFTTEEILALGDFPDYAELSGVPLPEPYKEFIFEKALPRPYRPFRWSYHQTMCKFLICFGESRKTLIEIRRQLLRNLSPTGGWKWTTNMQTASHNGKICSRNIAKLSLIIYLGRSWLAKN
jgi:hypothetical protein